MSQRIYRSARGSKIDMGDIMLRNEDVRAVGNMSVNARGDKIDNKGTVTKTRNQQVNKTYRKQITNQVTDVPPQPSTVASTLAVSIDEPIVEVEGLDTRLDTRLENKEVQQNTTKTQKTTATNTLKKKAKSGLAGAIAKAREVEQKKLKTDKEEAKSKKGVKKI